MSFVTSLSIFDDVECEVNLEKLLQVHINEIKIHSNDLGPRIGEDDKAACGGVIEVLKREPDAPKNHHSRSHLNPLAARAALALSRSNSSEKADHSALYPAPTNTSTESNHTKPTSKKRKCSSFSSPKIKLKSEARTRGRGRKSSSRVEHDLLKKKGTKFSPRLNFLPRLRSQKGS